MIINRKLSLKKNFQWGFIGNAIYSATQWGLLIVMAKLGSAEFVGLFTLGLAISAPIQILFNLQLRSVLTTDLNNEYQFGDYLAVRIITSLMTFLIIFFVAIMLGYDQGTTFMVLLIVGFMKSIEACSDITHGLMQQKERMDLIAISKVIRGILALLIFSIFMYISDSLIISLISVTVTWFLIFIFLDLKTVSSLSKWKFSFNKSIVIKIVLPAIPLGLAQSLSSFNTNIPRYFLEGYFGAEELGYFASITYFIMVGNTLVSALGQTVLPRITRLINANNKSSLFTFLLKLELVGMFIGVIGCAISLFLGEMLLTLFYSKAYAEYNWLFLLVMVAALFNYMGTFLGTCIMGFRKFRLQLYMSFLWISVTLVSSWFIIPTFGIKGAAYVLIISSFTIFISRLFVTAYLIIKME